MRTTSTKLEVRDIIKITKAMNVMEELNIAFSDFTFNLALGKLGTDALAITDPHDIAYRKTITERRKENKPFDSEEIDKMLSKKHFIEIPEITEELLKKTGNPLPVMVIGVLSKYIKKS